jgi:hypothetical protein
MNKAKSTTSIPTTINKLPRIVNTLAPAVEIELAVGATPRVTTPRLTEVDFAPMPVPIVITVLLGNLEIVDKAGVESKGITVAVTRGAVAVTTEEAPPAALTVPMTRELNAVRMTDDNFPEAVAVTWQIVV